VLVPKGDRAETRENPSITPADARREAFEQANHVQQGGRDVADRFSAGRCEVTVEIYAATLAPGTVEREGLRVDGAGLAASSTRTSTAAGDRSTRPGRSGIERVQARIPARRARAEWWTSHAGGDESGP
jgi:hypothetical protein